MIKIYGSMLCNDCIQCRAELDSVGIAYEFLDFADSLLYLKDFLQIRDSSDLFVAVKESGSIGIPCIVKEDGNITFDWGEFLM